MRKRTLNRKLESNAGAMMRELEMVVRGFEAAIQESPEKRAWFFSFMQTTVEKHIRPLLAEIRGEAVPDIEKIREAEIHPILCSCTKCGAMFSRAKDETTELCPVCAAAA